MTPAPLDPPKRSGRGFQHFDPVPSEYGGTVEAYESSAASAPHIWLLATVPVDLNKPDGATVEAPVHLTLDNAGLLSAQLAYLVGHHYQLAAPEPEAGAEWSADWNRVVLTVVPVALSECRDCSALVADNHDARSNHEIWHDRAAPDPSKGASE